MRENQIVFYSKKNINRQGKLRLIGAAADFQGGPKRPSSEEITTEFRIIVDDCESRVIVSSFQELVGQLMFDRETFRGKRENHERL